MSFYFKIYTQILSFLLVPLIFSTYESKTAVKESECVNYKMPHKSFTVHCSAPSLSGSTEQARIYIITQTQNLSRALCASSQPLQLSFSRVCLVINEQHGDRGTESEDEERLMSGALMFLQTLKGLCESGRKEHPDALGPCRCHAND